MPNDLLQYITATQYRAGCWFHIRGARGRKPRSPRQQLNRRGLVSERSAAQVDFQPLRCHVEWLRRTIFWEIIT